ncbi:VTT domain-containing protein [Marispirochaeta sp.]|uniref:VTT domain-containing protein n=1 Tax=Marispirochaeta sp. TaxID=2038653 RepID=UPI0029C74B0F|nr:VTT domain-containing protein [Marispirochaeta sp.]
MTFKQDLHYEYISTASRLSFFTSSGAYYSALADILPRARRRILIVGWSFDDRIHLLRNKDTGPTGPELGDLLISAAEKNTSLQITLCIWKPPSLFAADQHITNKFRKRLRRVPNITLCQYPAESAFASRHEKYVVVDDVLAFLGGIDLTRERWDSPDHPAQSAGRVNPDSEPYGPYHDTHAVLSGPVVGDILSMAEAEFPLDLPSVQTAEDLWPNDVSAEVENARVMISLTRASPDAEVADVHQIKQVYCDMVADAKNCIFIENQYFSSDVITDLIVEGLRSKDGPEVIIFMSRELPDMLGRMTMGVNASMHIAKLKENDLYGRLGFFNLVSSDNTNVGVKVHSKLLITDSRYLSLGSANINQRSFSFDDEVNIIIDAAETGEPQCVGNLEERILGQHCGLSVEEWRTLVAHHDGSRLKALREHSTSRDGLEEGKDFLPPDSVPREILNYFDMEGAPQPEEALHTMTKDQPRGFIYRTRKIWGLLLLSAAVLGAVFFFARTDIDIRQVLGAITQLNETRPVIAALLTIASFWFAMLVFVSITIPIVSFAALHGPWFGILYSSLGVFSGAAIFYGLGLLLHNSSWFERYKAVRRVKKQFEKIRPYGFWAVAISRMIPSGPFLVVNLVTGMLGFKPSQFSAGSLIGLMPGIVVFTLFGETIRNVFTNPAG